MKTTLATALSLIGVIGAGSAAALVNTSIFDSSTNDAAASEVIVPEAVIVELTLPQPQPGAPSASSNQFDSLLSGGSQSEVPSTPQQSSPSEPDAAPAPSGATSQATPSVTQPASTPASPATKTTVAAAAVTDTTSPANSTPQTTIASPSTTTPPASSAVTYKIDTAGTVTVEVVNGSLKVIETTKNAGWSISWRTQNPDTNTVGVQFVSTTMEVDFTAVYANGVITPTLTSRTIGGGYDDDHDDDEDHDDDDDHEYEEHDDDHDEWDDD